jgi:hypothetical protein
LANSCIHNGRAALNDRCANGRESRTETILTGSGHLSIIRVPFSRDLPAHCTPFSSETRLFLHRKDAPMLRMAISRLALTLCGAPLLLCGCLALSFGGKSQGDTVLSESVLTQERLGKLEARVDALEQQVAPQLAPPVTVP